MKESLLSIAVIAILLIAGFASGKMVGEKTRVLLLGQLSNIVLLLLLCMGLDFGSVFTNKEIGVTIIKNAFFLSGLISAITFLLLFNKKEGKSASGFEKGFFAPFKGCAKAFLAFSLGISLYVFTGFKLESVGLSSNYVLYIIIYLVGLDLISFKLTKLNMDVMKVPFITVIATGAAVLIFSEVSSYSWRQSLVVSSGFGWFSLSGPMVNQLVSPEMGAMAFMTDFFREMFSIVFLYFLGKSQPRSAIGISGAAALDSALPFIKENCDQFFIRYAIVSGFILTLFAPFFISLSVAIL